MMTDADQQKDLRRRGAELDMAHKSYDRAKGHFHSRKARSTCTVCHAIRPSRRDRPAQPGAMYDGDDHDDLYDASWHVDSYPSHGDEAQLHLQLHSDACAVTRVVVKQERKRKGVAADYEIIPVASASHGVVALDDEHKARVPEPQDEWFFVDSLNASSAPRPSYASALRGASESSASGSE
ncbi:hypothetical protein EXIGLDRAFT_759713 [Exidia glandulosa HHB12029]|uniref:Uncharacterized protein n=1 Tax=Exidia glandulosa HHB12029 TaxID=1314781 RepID=A0A165PRX3_EXIGL|nr:hypothetical protein EXIGLDRAFT_759713 [Exidia glandulosa HHB12029]